MRHRYPKRSQLKYTRKRYQVRNWPEYETALRKRGDLTLWFSDDAILAWQAPASSHPGGQRIYSDLAIETALTVRAVYQLALRQTEGFLRSISRLLSLSIRIPDHSTLSRRSKHLECFHRHSIGGSGPIHILIDSTGVKAHGGANCLPQPRNQRAWRKLHLVVDAVSAEIIASELTTHRSRDSSQVPVLLSQVDRELETVAADGAYDVRPVYKAIAKRPSKRVTRVLIPPRRNARLSRLSSTTTSQRDQHIQSINEIGRRQWEKESGYSTRSLVETAISRYKRVIGRRLRSRTLPSQRTEVRIACAVLNRMTRLGMPDGYCVA